MYKNEDKIMEWDGVLVCNNETFLLECKHKMTDIVSIKELLYPYEFINSLSY
jgi:hypothetical protein